MTDAPVLITDTPEGVVLYDTNGTPLLYDSSYGLGVDIKRLPAVSLASNAMTLADGADAAEGSTTDAVVVAGAAGTLSAKLRRLTTDLSALLALIPTALATGGGLKSAPWGPDGNTLLPTAAALSDTLNRAAVTTQVGAQLLADNGTNAVRVRAAAYGSQDGAGASLNMLGVASLNVDFNGASLDRHRVPIGVSGAAAIPFKTVHAQAITAATGITIWTPASGKKFRLLGFAFSSSAAASLLFYDGAAGALTTKIYETPILAALDWIALPFPSLGNGIFSAAANNTLALDVSATATVTGCVFGCEE